MSDHAPCGRCTCCRISAPGFRALVAENAQLEEAVAQLAIERNRLALQLTRLLDQQSSLAVNAKETP